MGTEQVKFEGEITISHSFDVTNLAGDETNTIHAGRTYRILPTISGEQYSISRGSNYRVYSKRNYLREAYDMRWIKILI